MKKRTKIIILSVMVVLLGVTGYLNIVLNNSISPTTTTTTTSYFVSYRNERETSRDQQMLYLDAIISDTNSTEEEIANAKQEKNDILALMEEELAVEGLIKAEGYNDCVVFINDNGVVNVVVDSAELTFNEAQNIKDIVCLQLTCEPKDVVINPYE